VVRLSFLVLVACTAPVRAEDTPTCEQQVEHAVRQLSAERVLAEGATGSWQQALGAITSGLRVQHTLVEIETQQTTLAKTNVAQLLEQLRLAQGQLTALRQELDAAKKSAAAPQ